MRRWLAVAGLLCLASEVWAGGLTPAQEQSELDKGVQAYRDRAYNEAAARFEAMTKPGGEKELQSPSKRADAHFYLGATHLGLGNTNKADEEFLWVLLDGVRREQDYFVAPTDFPKSVQDAFRASEANHSLEIRAEKQRIAQAKQAQKLKEEQEKERQKRYVAALERNAGEQIVTQTRSRWLTFVPFGVGQFQNGKTVLGLIFLGTETAFLTASVVTWGMFLYNKNERDSFNPPYGTRSLDPSPDRSTT